MTLSGLSGSVISAILWYAVSIVLMLAGAVMILIERYAAFRAIRRKAASGARPAGGWLYARVLGVTLILLAGVCFAIASVKAGRAQDRDTPSGVVQ